MCDAYIFGDWQLVKVWWKVSCLLSPSSPSYIVCVWFILSADIGSVVCAFGLCFFSRFSIISSALWISSALPRCGLLSADSFPIYFPIDSKRYCLVVWFWFVGLYTKNAPAYKQVRLFCLSVFCVYRSVTQSII